MSEKPISTINVYVNDMFYKTFRIDATGYNPKLIMDQLISDRNAGLLNKFNLLNGMKIRYDTVK